MARIHAPRRRRAATTVEAAFVLPLTFAIMFGLVIGAMGVFRYQETVYLAREGARYASTHGGQFRKDAGLPVGDSTVWHNDIVNNCIHPRLMAMDASQLTVKVSWPPVINQPTKPDNWPGSKAVVTVTYKWIPVWLFNPVTFRSVSELPITN